MITLEKLRIYRKFDGNDEMWGLAGNPGGEIISYRDWSEIAELLQELTPIKMGLASPHYAERIRKKLKEMAENEAAAQAIYELA